MSDDIRSPSLDWIGPGIDSPIDWPPSADWAIGERRPKWEQGDEAFFPASEGGLLLADLGADRNAENPCTRGLDVDDSTLPLDGSIPAIPADSLPVESGGTLDLSEEDSPDALSDWPPSRDWDEEKNGLAGEKPASQA
jgi:hypothetical protein